MTAAKKLLTMETLEDNLSKGKANAPVPSWQKSILDKRERLIKQGKAQFSPWQAARKRLSEKMS
jgi:hypothetical protein